MKLHRLRLKNFRGVEDREVCFASTGVTVVAGRNEAGKSSMVEALDALLELPSSSKSRGVRALAPSGRDVGTEVEAEISSGAWHFTYFKRFNRSIATELTVYAPQPEQHSGRDAEARARELLSGEMDLTLFRAVRLMQSGAPELVDATGSTALTAALDRAVGAAECVDGSTEELLAAVGEEYCRYFTEKAGRPTGELADAQRRLASAQGSYAARARGIEAVAQDAATLEEALARKKKLAHVVELRRAEGEELDEQLAAAAAARAAHEGAQQALALAVATARLADRDVADRGSRRTRLATLRERESDAVRRRDDALGRADEVGVKIVSAQQLLADLKEQERVAAAARREQLLAEAAVAQETLAANRMDSAARSHARRLARELAQATARWEAAAASFTVEALGDAPVLVDGEATSGGDFRSATAETVVEVDGVVRVTITSASDSRASARALADVRTDVETFCAAHDLTSLDDAEERAEERAATVRTIAALTERLEHPAPSDSAAAVAEARTALAALQSQEREQRAAAQSASEELARVTADIDELVRHIAVADEQHGDEQAVAIAAEARQAASAAERRAAATRGELELLAVADLDRRRSVLDGQLGALDREIGATEREVVTCSTRIEVCRTDNRLDELHDAAAELADAEHALARVAERADAARLLYLTLRAKRQESHARYADPFRTRLEELSAPLFGPGVRFGVDDDLTITSRTVDGVTVPYESLSGGAREQLGLLARLACAMLVDESDGVPVIIDDALGSSDTDRTASMAQVLTAAGEQSQIIVLTCVPERYAHVDAAARVAV